MGGICVSQYDPAAFMIPKSLLDPTHLFLIGRLYVFIQLSGLGTGSHMALSGNNHLPSGHKTWLAGKFTTR